MIIGVGLGRTGTASLAEALRIVGYRTYHGKGVLPNAWRGDYHLEGEWDALVETPFVRMFSLADQMFPDSKFILTVRDMDAWLKSWESRQTPRRRKTARRHGRVNIFGAYRFDPQVWACAYRQHDTLVRAYFQDRPDDLLIIDVTQGPQWRPLCEFVGRDVPDVDWPHLNRGRHENSRRIANL